MLNSLLPFPPLTLPLSLHSLALCLRYVLTIFYNIFDRCDLLRSPARLSIFPLFSFRASCVWEKLIETLLSTEPQTLRSQATGNQGELPASLSHCLKLSAGDQRPTSWQTLEFPPHDHSAKWSRVALCSHCQCQCQCPSLNQALCAIQLCMTELQTLTPR